MTTIETMAGEFAKAIRAGNYIVAAALTEAARKRGYSLEAQPEGVRWRKL